MKATENMGFYIDSEEPYFRFKIEMNEQGTMRTLLLPEEFDDFPEKINGKARITKAFPNKAPYASLIELKEEPTGAIVNKALRDSYQNKAEIIVGSKDCSFLFSKLPPSNLAKKFDEIIDEPLPNFIGDNQFILKEIEKERSEKERSKKEMSEEEIIRFFSNKGFTLLGSKEIKFFCPCSKERMIANLLTLGKEDLTNIFEKERSVEIRCDYCNTLYEIKESELKAQ
jgi:molecular chaperone Hsp33